MRPWIAVALAAALTALAPQARAAELQPFTAEYAIKYSTLSVGGSRLELRRDDRPGRWILESRANASGLARLLAGGTLVQTSWLEVSGQGVRPLRFRFDDGMERRQEDSEFHFDWAAGRVTGIAKGEAVDVAAVPNLQDPVSIQVATMYALLAGRQPGQLPMIDGRKVKTYDYALLRRERLKTRAGTFDTVVYTSSRTGSERVTHMWLAPELGYLAVQVEQHREGKRLFAMYLEKYTAGSANPRP
jgi:hypothetical protein